MGKRNWFFPVLSGLLVIMLAFAGLILQHVNRNRNELRQKVTDLEEQLAQIPDTETVMAENEGVELSNGEIYYSRETIKQKARDAETLTELMSMIFYDHAVYYNGEKYIYSPISEAMRQHDYDLDGIVTDPVSGFKTYSDSKGRVGLRGIDVSTWQGDIDWARVKESGIDFAIIRAGLRGYESGNLFEDDMARSNLYGATSNGIPVGVYFYSQAVTPAEGKAEAEKILEIISGYDVTWPIVIDVELDSAESARANRLSAAQRTDVVIAFCERILEAGYTPMIYGNMRMLCGELEPERLDKYEKWLAQYYNKPRYPYDFGIWQYSSTAQVRGISGNVDVNIAFKDYGNQ